MLGLGVVQRSSAIEVVLTDFKVLAHRDPLIKDEALPLPQTVFSGDFFEVLQDATLKVIHRFHPSLA